MKKLITTLSLAFSCTLGFGQMVTNWVNPLSSTSIESGADLEFDENGLVTVVGHFSGTVNFNPKGTANNITSEGGKDIFVAKYTTTGVLSWVRTIGGTADDEAISLDIDAGNNLLVGGMFASTNVDFDPGTGTTLLSSSGSTDIFILKLNTTGVYLWAQRAGGTQGEFLTDVVTDNSSNIFLAGSFPALMDFFANTNTLTNGGRDAFLCKLNSAGTYQWVKAIGGAGTDVSNKLCRVGTAIGICSDVGSGSTTFDYGGASNGTFSGTGTNGIYTIFSTDGNHVGFGQTTGNTRCVKMVSTGSMYAIVGTFSGTCDIAPGATSISVTSTGTTNMFMVSLSGSIGSLSARDHFEVTGTSSTHQIVPSDAMFVLGANSNIFDLYITGYAKGAGNFDGITGSEITGPASNDFSFISKYNVAISTNPLIPEFTYKYTYANANSTNTANASRGLGISANGSADVVCTGFFYSTSSAQTLFYPGGTIGFTSPSSSNDGFIQHLSTCSTPTITPTGVSRCGTGTVTLTANPSAGVVNWYSSLTSTTVLSTGTTFTTPSLTDTTVYYAQAVNGSCLSNRVGVGATIIPIATITVTSGSRCGSGTVGLSASSSVGSISWYSSTTSIQPLAGGTNYTTPNISTTTTYYAQAINFGCNSARTAVVATINATPTMSTTPNTRCGTGTVVLGATPSAGTVSWFAASSGGSALATGTSFTTPSISTTTTYYAEATLGTCTSARTAVVATVVANPTITGTPNARCGTGTVVLGATPSAGTVSWYAASSGGSALATGTSYTTPSIASSTTYYVEAVSGTCISPRIAVIATVNSVPTISTTGAARCGSGSVGLGATPSAGTVSWFTSSSGGSALATGNSFTTPSISATTTYFAETNASGCISTRTAAIATINTIPTISTTPNTRCGTGTVVLGATPSAGTVSWFAGSSGGSALATGTSFTTPSISTTTTYFAEATLGTCSSVRSAVIATIAANTTITGTPNARCGTGTVVLGATPTAGTVSWYAASSGGSALATGTSYTTPSIASSTTYYAEAVSGTCISPRIAVIATVNSVPTISTTGAARCGAGSVNLSATPSAGTVSWFAASSGGSALNTGNSFITPGITATTTYFAETNENGCTSTRTAAIATVNPVPTITEIPDARCGTGTVTLGATPSAGTVSWFAASSGGSALATGTSFTTPSISTTTTYYAEAILGTCISTRVPVVATIITSAPTITAVPNARCGAGTVVLGATPSAGTVSWYAASSGGSALATGTSYTTPSIASTTTFYAEAIAGTCSSPRIAVIATINSVPTISTTGAARCGAGSVNLSATPSAGTVSWFASSSGGSALNTGNSFITPGISATTTYFAETNANGCTSTRTAAIATVNPVPTITEIPDARCGTGTITLGATPSAGTVSWFAASSGGSALATGTSFTTPSISITTTYYAEAVLGTCISTRVPVVATIITSSPIITAVPNARCGTGTVVLGATPSAGTVSWYAASSGGSALATGTSYTTPSIASTTAFYAEAIAGTCSSPRIAVIATVNAAPTISTTGASRCGAGSVNLGATPSAGTVSWFAASSGGSALNTGNSFITPGISATTTYFAETNANGCISTRTPAIATINNLPDVDISSIGTTLTVVEAGAVYEWVTCTNQNYSPIVVGITSQQSYEGVDGGEYAVFVTKGGCTDTSNCTLITVSNASEQIMDYIDAKVYPNPSSDKVTIELSQDTEVEILDQTGKLVKSIFVNGNQSYTIDNLQAGLYNLKAKNSLKPNLGKILIIK